MNQTSKFIRQLFSLALVVGLIYAALNARQLLAWYRGYTYQPSAEVAQLVVDTGMTSEARTIFYQSAPTIDTDRTVFSGHCRQPVSSPAVELGCYTAGGKIYLLSMSEPAFADVIKVTAAHELLHAVYDRLGPAERSDLASKLEQAASSLESPTLQQELANYEVTEPGARVNELHSLLGTEYSPLSPELEQHYARYFQQRPNIVAANQRYEQVFNSLQVQLDRLSKSIASTRQQMRQYLADGNIPAYNALVPQVNAQISQYNATVNRYNMLSRSLRGEEDELQTQ